MDLGPLAEKLGPDSRLAQHLDNVQFPKTATAAVSSSSSSSSSARPVRSSEQTDILAYAKTKTKHVAKASSSEKKMEKASAKHLQVLGTFIKTKKASGANGHLYRESKGMQPGTRAFDKHKYGKQQKAKVRKKHWDNYAPMRAMAVIKRPAAMKGKAAPRGRAASGS